MYAYTCILLHTAFHLQLNNTANHLKLNSEYDVYIHLYKCINCRLKFPALLELKYCHVCMYICKYVSKVLVSGINVATARY